MDSTSTYSYGRSRELLDEMPEQLQEAFVVYCSARMLPFYDAFARRMKLRDPGALRRIVDRLWTLIVEGEIAEGEMREMQKSLKQLDVAEEACCDEWREALAAADAVDGAFWWCCFTATTHPVAAIEAIRDVLYQRLKDDLPRPRISDDGPNNQEADWIFGHPMMRSAMQDVMGVLEFLKEREELVEGDVKYLRMLAEKRLVPDK